MPQYSVESVENVRKSILEGMVAWTEIVLKKSLLKSELNLRIDLRHDKVKQAELCPCLEKANSAKCQFLTCSGR